MYMTATAYPELRASLAPEYLELSDEQLDYLVAEMYGPGVSAEAVESFWNDVGRGFSTVAKGVGKFAQQAAPVVARALPAMAQGAVSGASVGGPFGAIAGAVAGGAGGVLSQSRDPTLRGIGGAIGGVTQLASRFTPGGAIGNLASGAIGNLAGVALGSLGKRGGAAGTIGKLAGGALGGLQRGGAAGALSGLAGSAFGALQRSGGAAGAIGQIGGALAPQLAGALGGGARGGSANALLGLLSRPETLRALSSAAMGQFGRSQVLVGQQPVSVQSILGALGGLAGRAAAEAEVESSGALPAYLHGADGELAFDPADAEQRTDAVLELFATTPSPHAYRRLPSREAWNDESSWPEYTDEDAINDEWLLASEAEMWLEGETDELDA